MLNQLLLLLIDFSAYMEKHFSHTEVQSSILHKAVVYLTLNMLIIPGLTIAATKSFVNILSDKEFLLADILGELHVGVFGAFLVNVLLQKATFSLFPPFGSRRALQGSTEALPVRGDGPGGEVHDPVGHCNAMPGPNWMKPEVPFHAANGPRGNSREKTDVCFDAIETETLPVER